MILTLPATRVSAAIEVGDSCMADAVEMNRTLIARDRDGGPFSLGQVVSKGATGVVTRWGVRVAAGQPSIPQRLEIYRSLMGPKDVVRKEAETPLQTLHAGENSFQSRISVPASTEPGLYGPEGTFACHTQESVSAWIFEGTTSVGGSMLLTGLNGFRTPVTVVVEPDRDGDGYGDETQDHCTIDPATQDDCPAVDLRVEATAKERSILFRVAVDTKTKVHILGQVAWTFKRPERGDKGTQLVGLQSGVRTVPPGRHALLEVKLPKPVLQKLDRLSQRKSLKAEITVYALSDAGREVTRTLAVRLPGQKGT